MQPIHRELIALMPNAVDRPNEGQMVIRQLDTWDDHEAARVTLERFGDKAVSYHVGPDHVMVIRPGGITQPAKLALHIEFDHATGREPVEFYNDLPENMRGWRNNNAEAIAGQGDVTAATRPQLAANQVGFDDFIEELRRNNVRLLLSNGQTDRYRERQPNRWSVPVYDFGGLVQPTMPDYLGEDLIDRLLHETPSNPEPPASACVFIQRFKMDESLDPDQSGLATLLLRVEGLTAAGQPNITFVAQHHTHWIGANGELLRGCWRTLEPKLLAEDRQLTAWHRRWAAEFTAMLAGWRDDIEFRETDGLTISKINAKRKRAGQKPISRTKVIHIVGQRVQYLRDLAQAGVRSPNQGGTHASPHEHLRTICSREVSYIRNGKEVRYRFKKAGQKVSVKPRMAANDNTCGGLEVPIYRIVR